MGWLAASLIPAILSWQAIAQDTPTHAAPSPPVGARSRTSGSAAERTAQVRCLALATSALQTYAGPDLARENAAGAFFMSCMIHQMPIDWPDAADAKDQATRMAETARRADPSIDACLLTACSSPPKDDTPINGR